MLRHLLYFQDKLLTMQEPSYGIFKGKKEATFIRIDPISHQEYPSGKMIKLFKSLVVPYLHFLLSKLTVQAFLHQHLLVIEVGLLTIEPQQIYQEVFLSFWIQTS